MRAWRDQLRRLRLSLDLLVGRHAGAVIGADLLVLLPGFIAVALGEADSRAFWSWLVLAPLLLLGVPVLADAVALERRSGSLDLALSSPGASFYFERRIGSFAALLAAQGMVAMTIDWLLSPGPYPLLLCLAQVVVTTAMLAAASLFWGVRLRSNGAVVFALYLTVAVLAPWFFHNPVPKTGSASGLLVYPWYESLLWARTNLVLALAAVAFYLYARRRLERPEKLLA